MEGVVELALQPHSNSGSASDVYGPDLRSELGVHPDLSRLWEVLPHPVVEPDLSERLVPTEVARGFGIEERVTATLAVTLSKGGMNVD